MLNLLIVAEGLNDAQLKVPVFVPVGAAMLKA